MKKYKAIIYDLDGTVLDTLKMNMIPLLKIIKEETGEDWSFEQVLKFASYPGMKVIEELHVKNPTEVRNMLADKIEEEKVKRGFRVAEFN